MGAPQSDWYSVCAMMKGGKMSDAQGRATISGENILEDFELIGVDLDEAVLGLGEWIRNTKVAHQHEISRLEAKIHDLHTTIEVLSERRELTGSFWCRSCAPGQFTPYQHRISHTCINREVCVCSGPHPRPMEQ